MLRNLFEDACSIRMRSDVPIGTALSGGVDSSAVIGFMKNIADKNISNVNGDWRNVFVASLPRTSIDETEYAQIAAEHVGLKINKVKINPNIELEKIYEYMCMCEEPFTTSPIPFMQTYGEIAKRGIKVTLDGHGADELFGGYSFDVLEACSMDSSEDEIRLAYDIYLNMLGKFSEPISFQNFKKMINKKDTKIVNNGFERLNSRLYYETHENVLPTLFRCYDHYSMSSGLEIRMRFMDYRVVSFVFSIDTVVEFGSGGGYLLNQLKAKNKILNRNKRVSKKEC